MVALLNSLRIFRLNCRDREHTYMHTGEVTPYTALRRESAGHVRFPHGKGREGWRLTARGDEIVPQGGVFFSPTGKLPEKVKRRSYPNGYDLLELAM